MALQASRPGPDPILTCGPAGGRFQTGPTAHSRPNAFPVSDVAAREVRESGRVCVASAGILVSGRQIRLGPAGPAIDGVFHAQAKEIPARRRRIDCSAATPINIRIQGAGSGTDGPGATALTIPLLNTR